MKLFYSCLLPIISLLIISCQKNAKAPIKRPIDPWVFRSVLDKRPRMITLALNKDLYVAYDVNKCGLYKIWKGGLDINGAPYNGIKVVHPAPWGHIYATDSLSKPIWKLEDKPLRVSFKGYRFLNNSIHFNYLLTNDSRDSIKVSENVEFLDDKKGQHGLKRVFSCSSFPENSSLTLESMEKVYSLKSNAQTEITQMFDAIGDVIRGEEEVSSSTEKYWLEKSGCSTCHEMIDQTIGPGYMQIAEKYDRTPENIESLVKKVKNGGSGVWGAVPMIPHPQYSDKDIGRMVGYILSLAPGKEKNSNRNLKRNFEEKTEKTEKTPLKPGFGAPLADVHPSYDLFTIRPEHFRPKVAAMDFMPDGSLLISTWDTLGAVYRLKGVETGDSSQVSVKRIAEGLAEPLGLKVVNGEIFVQQKPELTQLIDHDGDEIIDEYKTICNSFGVSIDFHEFALGLEYKDGYFYTNLSIPMRLMDHQWQLPDRGRTIKMARDGSFEHVNFGLRQPNGLGLGIDGELFATDNQGRWLPANKFIHIQPDVFHGSRAGIKGLSPDLKGKAPAVWLPQDEIGNSPSQPLPLNDGPYKGQMIHGEVTHGGVKRVFLEKIDGEYQGCVFRFMQGLEAGINRMAWGSDRALYVGGVGMKGNWGWGGKQFGLQRLKYNEKTTFEMLAVRAMPDGLEIEFTEALGEGEGEKQEDYLIQQWRYVATSNYGGPKVDLESLPIKGIKLSVDRKKARLIIPGLKREHVIYIRLNEDLKSKSDQGLWSSECWYTLNNIPVVL